MNWYTRFGKKMKLFLPRQEWLPFDYKIKGDVLDVIAKHNVETRIIGLKNNE